ncbi:MAG: hypothetical protein WCL07_03000 [bacterium]
MANAFGNIKNPLENFQSYGSVESANGLTKFISNISSVIIIVGGLYAFFNLLFAGITYITANGDSKKLESAVTNINMSLLGLVVLVGAAAITGVVSFVLFGSPTAILNPQVFGPGSFN